MKHWVFFSIIILLAFFSVTRWKQSKSLGVSFVKKVSKSSSQKISGVLVACKKDQVKLKNIIWEREEKNDLFLEVYLSEKARLYILKRNWIGKRIQVEAKFKTLEERLNPAAKSDRLFLYEVPKISLMEIEKAVECSQSFWKDVFYLLGARFEKWLTQKFEKFPQLYGFLQAVWKGNLEGLPSELKKNYETGGLIQILALSGQHILSLFLVLQTFLYLINRLVFLLTASARFCFPSNSYGLVFICGSFLWVTSQGSGSMLRSVAYCGSLLLLQQRSLFTSPLQRVCSVLGIIFIVDPSLLCNVSFILSSVASALQLLVLQRRSFSSGWKSYFYLSLWMPLLLLPIQTFYFSSLPLFSPFYTFVLSWFWEIILLPSAFFITFLGAVFSEASFFDFAKYAEAFIVFLYQGQERFFSWLPPKMIVTFVPTLWECLLWQLVLVFLLVPQKVMIKVS